MADREADIYEYLVSCQKLGHGFVIRAAKDRALSHPETGKRTGRLCAVARSAAPLGEFTLELRQRPHHPARTAHLVVSATSVALRGYPETQLGKKVDVVDSERISQQYRSARLWYRTVKYGSSIPQL